MSEYPEKVLWIVSGSGASTAEITEAAGWVHANAHTGVLDSFRPRGSDPCPDCWRAAAYAVKGFLMARSRTGGRS